MSFENENENSQKDIKLKSKETDPRLSEITKTWAEEIWHTKYHMKAPWGGKEAKLLQKTLRWMDSNYHDKDYAKKELLDALRRYVEDSDRYYADDRHPFSKFASKPEKWCVVWKKKERKMEEPIKQEEPKKTWEEFYAWAVANPRTAVKGFMWTSKILKQQNEARYDEVKTFLLDLVGKDQAIRWAKEESNLERAMP